MPGGGNTSENSGAREVRGVCFEERPTIRLVFRFAREISACGVMSLAKSVNKIISLCLKSKGLLECNRINKEVSRTFSFRGEENDMCERSFVVLNNRRGFVLGCSECQVIPLIYRKLELCSWRQNTRTFQAFKEYGKVILAFWFDHDKNRISCA